jgi:hypothetical protein
MAQPQNARYLCAIHCEQASLCTVKRVLLYTNFFVTSALYTKRSRLERFVALGNIDEAWHNIHGGPPSGGRTKQADQIGIQKLA